MLYVVTGNPGNGKSLYLVTMVEEMRVKENREVYQDGIEELLYPWKALPVERRTERRKNVDVEIIVVLWDQVPDGAIVVIDEAWRVFPIRTQGSVVPDFVQSLATHRHRGLDIFLATQQVKTQIDTFVRGLVGKHVHLDRKFGMSYSMKYEWEGIADPTSAKDVAVAQSGRWLFPKAQYGQYKSAVLHTHKARLPWKKFATFVGLFVVLGVCVWGAVHLIGPKKTQVALDSSGRAQGQGAPAAIGADFWVRDRIARVAGIPASAPVYDPLQKVRSQPRPEGCMQLQVGEAIRCECTGPNGSRLQISTSQCVELVRKGWFDETMKYPDAKSENIAQLSRGGGGGGGAASGPTEGMGTGEQAKP
jgi:zona occludens toxin